MHARQGVYYNLQLFWRRGKTVVSNATRWDTFEAMMSEEQLPPSEAAFRQRYQKSPSFLSIHMGVRSELLSEVQHCWAT